MTVPIESKRYLRKPLYVDAVRITAENFDDIASWCQGEVQTDEGPGPNTGKKYIKVRVHNPKSPRQTKAFVGDWLLYTERGYKVYTNKAFHTAFDIVVADDEDLDEEITYVPATPQAIAKAILDSEKARGDLDIPNKAVGLTD